MGNIVVEFVGAVRDESGRETMRPKMGDGCAGIGGDHHVTLWSVFVIPVCDLLGVIIERAVQSYKV